MKTFYSIICSLLVIAFAACTNTDDLKSDINSLKDRVSALETQVTELNNNIKSISALSKGGVTVSSLSHDLTNGTYTVTLSGGITLKLMEATSTTGKVPQIGIDADGYWQVSYDGGATFTQIKVGGNAVKAKGEDGLTPSFRISEEGYWEVSTDGTTYTRVLDVNGNPVLAKADGTVSSDKFFKSVSATDSELSIELQDGTKLAVPIVKDFFCYFDEQYTGVQKVEAGKSAEFDLHIKGAQSVVATAPDGWTVTVGEAESDVAKVTVTAPAATESADSRATADNTQDVSVIAMNGGYAQIAKIQVAAEASTTPDPDPDPTPSTITSFSLPVATATSFTDMPGWKTNENNATGTTNYWYHRENGTTAITTPSVEDGALKLFTTAKGSYNNSCVGYHCTSQLEKGLYKVSISVSADAVAITGNNKGIIGIAISNGLDTKYFRMLNPTKGEWNRNVTTFNQIDEAGIEKSFYIDTEKAWNVGKSTSLTTYDDSTDEELAAGFNIVLYNYNNAANGSVFVKSMTLEKDTTE